MKWEGGRWKNKEEENTERYQQGKHGNGMAFGIMYI